MRILKSVKTYPGKYQEIWEELREFPGKNMAISLEFFGREIPAVNPTCILTQKYSEYFYVKTIYHFSLSEKGWKYKLEASFLEIYNEEIRDLLATEKGLKYDIKKVDTKTSDIYVTNLKIENVTNGENIATLLKRAQKNRSVAATNCNERSSRSHSVFMLKITGENSITSESCIGTLNLVDLAGSERLKESGSTGLRLEETKNINSSLSNLSKVIMALANHKVIIFNSIHKKLCNFFFKYRLIY